MANLLIFIVYQHHKGFRNAANMTNILNIGHSLCSLLSRFQFDIVKHLVTLKV